MIIAILSLMLIILFLEFIVCLAHDHVVHDHLAVAKLYTSLPLCLTGNLVENTAHYAILKINEDSCFPWKPFTSYSHPLNL